uniref:histidine kinase n=1 Tax=Desulfobacca acetoxidans TaxID=60893 RepID=A0A7V4G8S8_9BACT
MKPAPLEEPARLLREEIWEVNVAALGARQEGLDLLPPLPDFPPPLQGVEVLPGVLPVLRVPGEGGGRLTLHSSRRPLEEAAEQAGRVPLGAGRPVAAFGLGLGYHLLALLPRLAPAANLFVVEKDPEVFWAALAAVDLTPLLTCPQVRLAVGREADLVVAWLKGHLGGRVPEDLYFFGHTPSLRAGQAYYPGVMAGLRPSAGAPALPRGLKKEGLRVLLINPDYFLIPEVFRAFRQLGHQAELLLFDKRREAGEEVLHRILRRLGDSPPDLVFTVNHLGFDREGVLLAALERLRAYRPTPLDLEVDLQEEVVLDTWEIGKPADKSRHELVELGSIVNDVLSGAVPAWEERGLCAGQMDIRVDIQPGCIVRGDATEIREAFANILLNAVQASSAGGAIDVRSGHSDGGIDLVVRDHGTGMSKETKERLFDPFFTTRGAQGTGLGMSMVDAIMIRHGGRISVESAEGVGTTITLRFPCPDQQHGV